MSECEHEWRKWHPWCATYRCIQTGCYKNMPSDEVERRLNEHTELKRELAKEKEWFSKTLHAGSKDALKMLDGIDEIAKLKRGVKSAHLHLLASICECGEPLKETDAFDVLDALLTAEEPKRC